MNCMLFELCALNSNERLAAMVEPAPVSSEAMHTALDALYETAEKDHGALPQVYLRTSTIGQNGSIREI